MKFFALLALSLIIFQKFPDAQEVHLTEGCRQAYEEILSLRFGKAEQILARERADNPGNVYVTYLENYIDFLTIFIGEDEARFDILEESKSRRVEQIRQLADSSPYRDYMLGNVHLQWAVARLKFGEYFTAALEINKAYRLLVRNQEEFPAFVPNKVSLGVLHVMIGMVPGQYHWLLNLISMHGSVEQGRTELANALSQCGQDDRYAYLKDEILFYTGFIDLNIHPDTDRLSMLIAQLEEEGSDNLLLSYLLANLLMRTGSNDRAIEVLSEARELKDAYPFYYLDYLIGECEIRKMEFSRAIDAYHRFLNNFSGRNYIGDAWRKLGWAALIEGDTARYFDNMEQVILFGNDDIDIDREALKEARSLTAPNAGLLKARLLFDGGYYPEADSVLYTIDLRSLDRTQLTELEYRKARVYHSSGDIARAKESYKITLELGRELPKYYAGNACLQLGEIYESEGELEKAKHFYETCLDLDFDEYENSIHSKAKAGLERVDK